MLIHRHFDFNLTDIGFTLTEMSLKQLLVSSDGKELLKKLYHSTTEDKEGYCKETVNIFAKMYTTP